MTSQPQEGRVFLCKNCFLDVGEAGGRYEQGVGEGMVC